jgi:hypothetical protein
MEKAIARKINCLRELTLAHHAYERSLQEFALEVGIHATSHARMTLNSALHAVDPREIDEEVLNNIIQLVE